MFVKSIDKFYKLVYNAVTVKKGEQTWYLLVYIKITESFHQR